ncbi:hypothetical protein H0H92_011353 [Tricholoma furcatifolium]|nr:hypothetical protein H0H92_011353 [Tricholoma furcatifolium]
MSDDDIIHLETPPASPPRQIEWPGANTVSCAAFDINDLPDADTELQLSPMKRSRVYSSYGPNRRRRRMNIESSSTRTASSSTPDLRALAGGDSVVLSGFAADHDYPSNDFSESPSILAELSMQTSSPTSTLGLDVDRSYERLEESIELFPPAGVGITNEADCYPEFVEAALSACLGIYRLTPSVYIVQGWDGKTATAMRRWYHLQAQKIGQETVNMCLCPNDEMDCVHARFLAQFGREEFPDDADLPVELGPVRLVFRDLSEGRHLFSVETPGKHGIKPRALVQHEGNIDGAGAWRCSKDGGQGCGHIQKARDYLQQLIMMDPSARDTTKLQGQAVQSTGLSNGISSVSFKSIVPPVWAELGTDLPLPYARPPPMTASPTLIRLEEDAQCICGTSRTPGTPIVVNTCRVYTILGSFDTEIELQRCTQCTGGRHRFIGPDCRHVGLFNYNNRILLSHDLLDDYTMAYTSSETPFTAWVSIAARRYEVHDSQNPFLGETVFRAAWFSYACLLALNGDFQCSRCGPVPQEPIFDGVVVAFSKSRILDSICPPTTTHDDSDIRQSRLLSDKAPIPKAKLRKNIRLIVDGPPLTIAPADDLSEEDNDSDDDESGDDTEAPDSTPLRRRVSKNVRRRMALIPSVVSELSTLDAALGNLFERLYYDNRASVPLPYKRFFMQMSSRESILQVANQQALEALDTLPLSRTGI